MPSSLPPRPRLRAALRHLLVGGLTLLVLLGASHFDAAASIGNVVISQSAFVQVCKNTGGTPTRVSTSVVRCTYPNGGTSTCNFITKHCTDDVPITAGGNASPISGGDVPIGGRVVFGASVDSPAGLLPGGGHAAAQHHGHKSHGHGAGQVVPLAGTAKATHPAKAKSAQHGTHRAK